MDQRGHTSPMRVPAISPVPIAERVAAVAEAGFIGLGLIRRRPAHHPRHRRFRRTTKHDRRPRTHPRRNRTDRTVVGPPRPGGELVEIRELLFEAADVLGPSFIKIGSELGPRTPHPERLIEPLRELATQAAEHGTRVAIETMPFSIIPTVPMGAEIVSAAAHPGIGLVVDAWHVFRAGTSLEELRAVLSPEMIFGVELDDAANDVVGTLFEDTVHHRLALRRRLFRPSRLGGSPARQGFRRAVGRGDTVVLVPTASGSTSRQAGRRVRANGAVISQAP